MRLTVSELQCYQRYRDSEDVTLEECLLQLTKREVPTPAMLAGRKLHEALEFAQYDWADRQRSHIRYKDYLFFFQTDIELAIPEVRELKGEMIVETSFGPIILVGVVDSIDTAIGDYKLSGHFDAERLAKSYQWRCYLQMFGAHKFIYKVFIGEEIKPKEWAIRDYHELTMFRYPGMEQDVQREVEQCVIFMRDHVWGRKAA
jgi:hypothetical protein